MKVIPLSSSAYAFEPDSDADRIEAITEERLRGYGLDDQAIRSFMQFRTARIKPPPGSDFLT
jgi:hypothetical protein